MEVPQGSFAVVKVNAVSSSNVTGGQVDTGDSKKTDYLVRYKREIASVVLFLVEEKTKHTHVRKKVWGTSHRS